MGAGDSGPAMDVEDLEVYRRAYQVSLAVHRASLGFPPIEQRALADQLRRASKSICANLAEGFGRRGHAPADFRRFVVMGIGSADEMRVWLRYARDLGYVEPAASRGLVRGLRRDRPHAARPPARPTAAPLIADR